MISISKLYAAKAQPGDSLRYGRRPPADGIARPVVVYNCTARCDLNCAHCYSHSTAAAAEQFDTGEALELIDDLGAFGCPVVLFSGGEPLLRADLPELVSTASARGVRPVLSTNGVHLSAERAEQLKAAGLVYAGVSLDGLRKTHDRFRGLQGAFDAAVAGVAAARQVGLKAGMRVTVHSGNYDEVPDLVSLAAELGVARLCFYHLVYAGRGRELQDRDLTGFQKRRLLDHLMDRAAELAEAGSELDILTVDNHADGPYVYLRLLRENPARAAEVLSLLRANGGNRTGIGIGCVSWDGRVHPDQFWRTVTLGNVRQRPFSAIWSDGGAGLLGQLRDRKSLLEGRCGRCAFQEVCNGNLRARAEAVTGRTWAADPACYLTEEELLAGPDGVS